MCGIQFGKITKKKLFLEIITRAISSSVLFLIIFIREIFLGGAQTLGVTS